MYRALTLGLASLVSLGGCSREPGQANDVDIANAADAARGSVDNYAALPGPVPRRDEPAHQAAAIIAATASPVGGQPSSMGSPADDSASAAAAVVARYYSLISAGRYAQSWRLWDGDGQASEMDQRSFAASFAKYATYRAEVGRPGQIDAGAGQRYVTVPVRVSGLLKDGARPFAMEGPVTLHRVADIDGASAAQLRWRISASGVRPRPDTGLAATATPPPTAASTDAPRD